MSVNNDKKGFIPFQGGGLTFIGLETGQVSVTPAATLVLAAESGRGRVVLSNMTGVTTIFVSGTSGMAATNGFPIPAGSLVQLEYTGDVYAIVNTVTTSLGWAALR